MESTGCYDKDLNLEATELRLGLPGTDQTEPTTNKRSIHQTKEEDQEGGSKVASSKAQIVGWPPVRSFRKNSVQPKKNKAGTEAEASGIYVKVSMDGAPYLRKINLNSYNGYDQLLVAVQSMFRITIGRHSEREGYGGSEHAPTYEDKDGDWMLVGDVPWEMFTRTCKRLRIMKGSEARGLGCGV
ncbi:hypothetical protein MLD38_027288 [Melastoma candidum]|uniref:Uncharacterized protein n=1 Tax=Melastoma candidum TaxID=119954 RepID=A0ACB9P2X6_9MYRT|nr:hypothetical protein MLD38_027288 [Melastoma candidum]